MKIDRTVLIADTTSVEDAINDFMLHQRSSRHSARTIAHYNNSFRHFLQFLGPRKDELLGDLVASDLREFFAKLQTQFKVKTAHGIASDIRALFSFHENEETITKNVMRKVSLPRLDKTVLPAFTEDDLKALLLACEGKDSLSLRNKALILVLLDSGVRLEELTSMKVGDVDRNTGTFNVFGKGRKDRTCRVGESTLRVLNRYRSVLKGNPDDPLWHGERGSLTLTGMATVIKKLGAKAGVHAHPHKFRRTFALMMHRNGADIYSIQHHLGHSDPTVVRRYLALNEQDYLKAHERYSPVRSLIGT